MERYFICNNPKCRFVLDRRINAKSPHDARLVLKNCPACGGSWSSTCPTCHGYLAVRMVGGLPHVACCNRNPNANRDPLRLQFANSDSSVSFAAD